MATHYSLCPTETLENSIVCMEQMRRAMQGDTVVYCSDQESRCLQALGTHPVHPSPKAE